MSQIPNTEQDCALFAACEEKDVKAAKAAIENGANVNAIDQRIKRGLTFSSNMPVLHLAITSRSKSVVKLLLKYDINVNSFDDKGYTPLHLLVLEMRDVKIAKSMIDLGANLNSLDKAKFSGVSPLHIALGYSKLDFAELLLAEGADINVACSENGRSPLLQQLKSISGSLSEREKAAALLLLEKGADPKVKDKKGSTTLHYAAGSGNVDMVNELAARGVEVTLNDSGEQPIIDSISTIARDIKMWDRLIELGCKDVTAALRRSEFYKNAFACKYFLKKGAKPNYPLR